MNTVRINNIGNLFSLELLNCGTRCLRALKQLIHFSLSTLASLVSIYLSMYPIVLQGKMHGARVIIFHIFFFFFTFVVP